MRRVRREELRGLVDEWRSVGSDARQVLAPPGKEEVVTFQIAAGTGAHSALYPVHVETAFSLGGKARIARAVRIFETRFPPSATADKSEQAVIQIPSRGCVPLTAVRDHRAGWAYFGRPEVHLPVGWKGSAKPSRASLEIGSYSPTYPVDCRKSLSRICTIRHMTIVWCL